MERRASARIERGVTTNRVRVDAPCRWCKGRGFRLRDGATCKRCLGDKIDVSLQRTMTRYKADPSVRGLDTAISTFSMPAVELADLDAACERLKLSRSHLLRLAVKDFIARRKP